MTPSISALESLTELVHLELHWEGDIPTSPEYELAPPAYENCYQVPLVTHWPSYAVCDVMELIDLELERRDAAAADSAVNLTMTAAIVLEPLEPYRSLWLCAPHPTLQPPL